MILFLNAFIKISLYQWMFLSLLLSHDKSILNIHHWYINICWLFFFVVWATAWMLTCLFTISSPLAMMIYFSSFSFIFFAIAFLYYFLYLFHLKFINQFCVYFWIIIYKIQRVLSHANTSSKLAPRGAIFSQIGWVELSSFFKFSKICLPTPVFFRTPAF